MGTVTGHKFSVDLMHKIKCVRICTLDHTTACVSNFNAMTQKQKSI